jgi:nucleoside-diphosphate-sugar epimerase
MIRLLVTGANGFIGRSCLDALSLGNVEVHATTSGTSAVNSTAAHWHVCNLLDRAAVTKLLEVLRPTHLLHLAWIATPGIYWRSPLNEAWRSASRHLAEAFLSSGGRRMVAAGTCAEYDWGAGVCRESEQDSYPSTPYAQAKLRLSSELAELFSPKGASLGWARIFWTYGPYEHASRFVPSVILSLLRGEPALCTAGEQRRDYMHVADLGAALARFVLSDVAGTVNVASGLAPTVASIARFIAAELGQSDLLRLGAIAQSPGEAPLVVADVDRLRSEIGFRPRFSLEAGLTDTIRWWQAALADPGHRAQRSSLLAF